MSLVKVDGSNVADLKKAIERSVNLIGFNSKIDAKKIVIKPNMCYYYHRSTGDITDPDFVGALIDVLRDNISSDPEISVVESDASAMKCKYVFRMLGYEKMAAEKDVRLVNLANERNRFFEIKIGDWYSRFSVPEIFYESDLVVNVPKIKYMDDVKITCALKNMYGCNAYSKKSIYHTKLNEAIVGINKLIKTDLVVVDGVVVCGTSTRRLGLVMASEDPVAMDAAASRIMGVDPKSVNQIVLASREGVGNMKFVPVGGSLSRFKDGFPRRGVKEKIRGFIASCYLRFFKSSLE